MKALFITSYVALWILVVFETTIILLALRHFGRRSMSSRERFAIAGLKVGAKAPQLSLEDLDTQRDLLEDGVPTMVLFSSAQCPICAQLWESVGPLSIEHPDIRWVWAGAGGYHTPALPEGWVVGQSSDWQLHKAFEAPTVPYAYMISSDRKVAAKGLVNSPLDLERLLAQSHTLAN